MSSKTNENWSKLNDAQEPIHFCDFSIWNNEKVCEWLKENNFSHYINSFRTNNIDGYDLCNISSQELLTELKVDSLHDRNSILKSIRKNLLSQLKIGLKYKEKIVEMQFDIDVSLTIAKFIPYIREVFDIKDRLLIYNNNNELLSINCKIVELCILDPSHYRTLVIENDMKRNESVSKYEMPFLNKETSTEIINSNHKKLIPLDNNNTKKRNVLKNQILKESSENNQSINQTTSAKTLSHNNYINITEDYKFEFPKSTPTDTKNFSLSQTNFISTPVEEKKLNNIQVHVTRNLHDQNEKKQLSDYDLRFKKMETQQNSKAKTNKNEEAYLNMSNPTDNKKNLMDYKSKLESVRTDIYNSWKKVQSPVVTNNERRFEN